LQEAGAKKIRVNCNKKRDSVLLARNPFFSVVRLAAHVSFARHGRALAGESPEHAQVVGNV